MTFFGLYHAYQTNQFYNTLSLKIMHGNNFTDFDMEYNGVQMILKVKDVWFDVKTCKHLYHSFLMNSLVFL